MPRVNDYPSAAFKSCLQIAEAVDDLGGACSIETCAERLDKQSTSGGFRMIISSAVKHGLITNNRGSLTVTSDYRLLKHAYNDQEKINLLQELFLRPEVFRNLHQRFTGKSLPVSMLDKIMIREMGVDDKTASRVSGYFVKGLKDVDLLDGDKVLPISKKDESYKDNLDANFDDDEVDTQSSTTSLPTQHSVITSSDIFTISITGPGVNNTFQITDEDDLEWVEVAIKKIKRTLQKQSNQ